MTEFQPNQVARQIITRLEQNRFTVKVPDAPHRAVWELVLDKPGARWFGVLYVSERKGRALRVSITWHPEDRPHQTRKAEGAHAIRALINQVTPNGWEITNA
ncbi:hypothetical protein AB0L53_47015 [Nonomuraea sp. NPDC052129]|uniref:hypothetical protein n=1 Tax=Nonomuraea sp. NPDC052129 TaxID=3154651 RepID=UPI003424BEB8